MDSMLQKKKKSKKGIANFASLLSAKESRKAHNSIRTDGTDTDWEAMDDVRTSKFPRIQIRASIVQNP